MVDGFHLSLWLEAQLPIENCPFVLAVFCPSIVARPEGQHSVRVNDRWRVCFVWTPKGPNDVEIVDYH